MDRFKFRVFNKKSNNYIKEKMFYIDEFGKLFKYKKSKSTVYINAPSPYVMGFCGDNYIVEQSTGLGDKNGKLIYEGDIVKDKAGHLYRIIWDDDASYTADPLPCNEWLEQMYASDVIFEIIGNIHENPELLEE